GEQALVAPTRLGRLAIEALAEQPEATAVAVFDPVVVAGALVRRAPPFAADPLGPLCARHLVQDAAPAELQRIALGDLGQGLDRPARTEHLPRPSVRIVVLEIGPGRVDQHACLRVQY